MCVIILVGSFCFFFCFSFLLEYVWEKLNGLDVEVYYWNL